jgi:hypothetical protein
MLNRLRKLTNKERQKLLNLIDSILFDRSVDRLEVLDELINLLNKASWSEKEIADFLKKEFEKDLQNGI